MALPTQGLDDPLGSGQDTKPRRRLVSRIGRLRTTIMAGLTIIAPLWITVWVVEKLFSLADGFSAPLIRQFARWLGEPDFHIPGLGFLLTFIILWGVGAVATNVVGKRLWQSAREALERLPLVRTIYAPIHQLMETMTSPEKAGFKKVVLLEYPRKTVWTLGFMAGDVPMGDGGEVANSIFVPTAPNPTTGFLLIVPSDQLRDTDLTVEEALKMIVSAGVVVPPSLSVTPGSAVAAEAAVFDPATLEARRLSKG
jgi:uncharacterized membrane protein